MGNEPVSAIRIENLSTAYGRHGEWVVTGSFSRELPRGTFVCLIGENGAGKSTLLRTLAGFQAPASGRVCLMGRDISTLGRRQLALSVAVVLTAGARTYSPRMSVEELVALGRIPHTGFFGRLSAHDRSCVEAAMHTAGIAEQMLTRRIDTLSDGERQKAMIAKALAQEAPIVLLDEPTAFLDFPGKAGVFRLMRSMAAEGGHTVVAATHDIGTAMHMANELWVMRRGMAPICGAPRELAARGKLDFLFDRAGAHFDRETLTYTL